MERLMQRVGLAQKAIDKMLELSCKQDYTEIERDALIQRFEFSYELVWKCAKDYLRVHDGIDAASPRRVIRACRELGVLDEQETKLALQMSDDRNLTVHTYDEAFAEVLAGRISGYAVFLQSWLARMAENVHFSE